MADEWIKLRACLFAGHPTVARLAELLDLDDPDFVVGKLARLWVYADQHTVSGLLAHATAKTVDRLVEWPGFAAALAAVGWGRPEDGGFRIERFEEHNTASTKKRLLHARRVAKSRKPTQSSGPALYPDPDESSAQEAHRKRTGSAHQRHPEREREEEIQDRDRGPESADSAQFAGPAEDANPAHPDESYGAELVRVRDAFNALWTLWPRKENRRLAEQKWRALQPDAGLCGRILGAVRAWLPVWAGRDPEHVPQAWGWIANGRWEDQVPAATPGGGTHGRERTKPGRPVDQHHRVGAPPGKYAGRVIRIDASLPAAAPPPDADAPPPAGDLPESGRGGAGP